MNSCRHIDTALPIADIRPQSPPAIPGWQVSFWRVSSSQRRCPTGLLSRCRQPDAASQTPARCEVASRSAPALDDPRCRQPEPCRRCHSRKNMMFCGRAPNEETIHMFAGFVGRSYNTEGQKTGRGKATYNSCTLADATAAGRRNYPACCGSFCYAALPCYHPQHSAGCIKIFEQHPFLWAYAHIE